MIPDRGECGKILEREGVPEHIRLHSELVASVALKLAGRLNLHGQTIDLELLEAGALLHDISKMTSIRNGGDHARLGGERVAELGCPELAPLIARHVDLGEWDEKGPVTEVELVNYSDKRVKHTTVVSLHERFEDLINRYGHTQWSREIITRHRDTLFDLERKIFAFLKTDPEDLEL